MELLLLLEPRGWPDLEGVGTPGRGMNSKGNRLMARSFCWGIHFVTGLDGLGQMTPEWAQVSAPVDCHPHEVASQPLHTGSSETASPSMQAWLGQGGRDRPFQDAAALMMARNLHHFQLCKVLH